MSEEHLEAALLDDEILSALKERYFKLAVKEKYPDTPTITKKLDELEKSIEARKEELAKAHD